MRNFGAGLLGAVVGGFLFRSLGFGGNGLGGSGIGLFEIILIAGIGYLIFRSVSMRRRAATSPDVNGLGNDSADSMASFPEGRKFEPVSETEPGLSDIRRMDPAFDEGRFKEIALDRFFKIQSTWMNRDLSLIDNLLTDEMRKIFQTEIDQMFREGRINRLENIALRKSEISEAWQESGQDFITLLIDANVLDYTTDDRSGTVVSGSKTEPVKFQEYWTFTRAVGDNPWKVSAINQPL
jgi:predicted lipid-binding transport protein (Tim44 family)